MPNDFYTVSGSPSTGSQGSSSVMRGEFTLIKAAFDKLAGLTGNSLKVVRVNSGESGFEAVSVTGTGSAVMNTSPTLVTPVLGVASGTSLALSGALTAASATVTGQLISSVAIGTAPLVVTSTTQVANLYAARAALADTATTATSATNASTVTTNANLTGPITSVGNATAIASKTGTGSTFVMATSPTLVTPDIGAATGSTLTLSSTLSATQLTSTVSTGTAPLVVSSTTKVTNLNADTLDGIDSTAFWQQSQLPYAAAQTWSPSFLAQVGAYGSTTINTARYTKIGDTYFFTFDATINTVGTASGSASVSLPAGVSVSNMARGRDQNNGVGLMATMLSGGSTMVVNTDANGSPIQANARIIISGFFQ
jgi:hypothetical protein